MFLERIHKAHEILFALEDIRYTIVTIGTLANPHLTEEYESELMDKLKETEMLLGRVKDCLHKKNATSPLSSDVPTEA